MMATRAANAWSPRLRGACVKSPRRLTLGDALPIGRSSYYPVSPSFSRGLTGVAVPSASYPAGPTAHPGPRQLQLDGPSARVSLMGGRPCKSFIPASRSLSPALHLRPFTAARLLLASPPTSARNPASTSTSSPSPSNIPPPPFVAPTNPPPPSPPPPSSAGPIARARAWVVRMWAGARYLFRFYWNGLKQIKRDRDTVKAIQDRLRKETAETGVQARPTRAEFQLMRTHRADLRKLPIFILILIILEEILPLVVLFAPGLLPSTCILPSQLDKIQGKAETKRAEAIESLRGARAAGLDAAAKIDWEGIRRGSVPLSSLPDTWEAMDSQIHMALCDAFGLKTRGPASRRRHRLAKHLGYIREDDRLLRLDDPHLTSLDLAALVSACGERGLRAHGLAADRLRRNLLTWLAVSARPDVSDGRLALLSPILYEGEGIDALRKALEEEGRVGAVEGAKKVAREVVEEERRAEEAARLKATAAVERSDGPTEGKKKQAAGGGGTA